MRDSLSTPNDFSILKLLKSDWNVLVWAGGLSIAQEIAPHVQRVTQVCPHETAAQATEEAAANALLDNIVVDTHDDSQYADNQFDLVINHHFRPMISDMEWWLHEAERILKSQGLLLLTAYLIPGTRLRGKKARRQRAAGDYVNSWLRLHSPDHKPFYSQHGLEDLLFTSGFELTRMETEPKNYDFATWVEEASSDYNDRLRLKAMLIQAPEKARDFLTPQFLGDKIHFRLPEITILATSKANKD